MAKKALPMAILFILLLSLVSIVNAEEEEEERKPTASTEVSCSQKLTVNSKLLPFDTTSLKCYTAWRSEDFVLMYEKSEGGDLWNFLLSAPDTGGYVSVGFSSNGKMVGSSAVVGWMTATGKGVAKQYYLGGEKPNLCIADKGDLNLVSSKTLILSQSSRLFLAFQLNSTSGEPKDKLIYAVGPKGSIPGSDLVLAEHRTMVSTTIAYATGDGEEEEESDSKTTTHGLLAMIGWGALVPVGVLVARYAKGWDPAWFYSHIVIQFAGFGLGIGAIVTGFRLEDDGEGGEDVDKHKAIGITILVLGTLQVMAVLVRPDKASKLRRYWNWYHHNFGRAAIALAIANIFYGLSIADEEKKWSIGYGVFLGIWVIVALVLEIGMCMKKE